MKIKIREREFDLSAALPLSLADLKSLKAKGVDMMEIGRNPGSIEVEGVSILVHHVVAKIDPSLSMADCDDISMPELRRFQEFLAESNQPKNVDRPT